MLGEAEGEGPSDCLEFVAKKGDAPQRFCVYPDFALLLGLFPCLVRLDRTEQIEIDVAQSVSTIHAGDYKIRVNYSSYPIYFYYRKSQPETGRNKKPKLDKVMIFPSREIRDQVAKMMSRPQE